MRKMLMRTCRGPAAPGGECCRASPASVDVSASEAAGLVLGNVPASRFDGSVVFTVEAGTFISPE